MLPLLQIWKKFRHTYPNVTFHFSCDSSKEGSWKSAKLPQGLKDRQKRSCSNICFCKSMKFLWFFVFSNGKIWTIAHISQGPSFYYVIQFWGPPISYCVIYEQPLTIATTSSGVLFSRRCPFLHRNAKFWQFGPFFCYFVTNLRIFLCPFFRPK